MKYDLESYWKGGVGFKLLEVRRECLLRLFEIQVLRVVMARTYVRTTDIVLCGLHSFELAILSDLLSQNGNSK